MSRYTSGLIPSTPTVYSGTALQGAINDFLSAFHSGSFDTVRPALAAKGMIWSKDIGANSVDIMFFDGTNNVQIGRVNTATSEFSGGVPVGGIIDWSGSIASIPYGWQLCDGTNGTPDLRGAFVLGAGGAYAVGDTGGAATHTLTAAEMPAHTHDDGTYATDTEPGHHHASKERNDFATGGSTNGLQAQDSGGADNGAAGSAAGGSHNHDVIGTSGSAGGGVAHNNMPPYYALAKIMRVF